MEKAQNKDRLGVRGGLGGMKEMDKRKGKDVEIRQPTWEEEMSSRLQSRPKQQAHGWRANQKAAEPPDT